MIYCHGDQVILLKIIGSPEEWAAVTGHKPTARERERMDGLTTYCEAVFVDEPGESFVVDVIDLAADDELAEIISTVANLAAKEIGRRFAVDLDAITVLSAKVTP